MTKVVLKLLPLEEKRKETAADINSVAIKNILFSGKGYSNPLLEPYSGFQNDC